ncbi:hypothetical protein [Alkalicoccus luteus]|uniref:hypothetical protein n=1 Tax=Alkalicoccus luteus TaxID=1237094 RepID=UPI004034051F
MLSTVQKQVVQQLQLAHSKKGLMAVFQAYIDATFPAGEPVLTAPLHQSAPLHPDAYFYRTALNDHPSGKPAVVQVKDRTGDDARFQIIPLYEPDGTRWEVLTRSTSWYPVVRWKQYQLQQMADVFFSENAGCRGSGTSRKKGRGCSLDSSIPGGTRYDFTKAVLLIGAPVSNEATGAAGYSNDGKAAAGAAKGGAGSHR